MSEDRLDEKCPDFFMEDTKWSYLSLFWIDFVKYLVD